MEPAESAEYFKSYENLEVHQLMLNDKPRNEAYRQAIFDNKDRIQGKVVLDVGAGTGILSVFCAQAGAAKVYAVEASDVYKIAENIVAENNFQDVIEVLHTKVEDVELPEKVDVIVSEWMGFHLFHEGMLDSVINARDRFLKPNGLIFPESATLYSAPCSVPSMFDNWDDVSGVSMSTFASQLRRDASRKPITRVVALDDVLAEPEVVAWVDLREATYDDVTEFRVQHLAVTVKPARYQGVCLWFVCSFPSTVTEPVTLSTEPDEPETHWRQTTIVFPEEIEVEQDAPLAYELVLRRNAENARRYDLELTMLDPDEVEHPEYCKCHKTKCILVRAMLVKYEREGVENMNVES